MAVQFVGHRRFVSQSFTIHDTLGNRSSPGQHETNGHTRSDRFPKVDRESSYCFDVPEVDDKPSICFGVRAMNLTILYQNISGGFSIFHKSII